MNRGSQKRTQSNFFLPEDVSLQILLLLPFESILACKRVCKQWYTLINDPNFSKNYHHKGSMILSLDEEDNLNCILTRHTPEITRYHIPISFAKGLNCKLLSGWSDGVACVKVANGYFHLYNLFTGASHTVEDDPLQPHSGMWMYCGFGYDRYDDDYKIMVVSDYKTLNWLRKYDDENRSDTYNEVQNKENSLFWVYSSRNRRWKSFDGLPFASYFWRSLSMRNPYSFNGVLHSAAIKQRDGLVTDERVIVTYDLHTRRFGKISVPDVMLRCSWEKAVELNGQLCYVYFLRYSTWAAEVYSVGGSWTKLLSIANSSFVHPMPSFYELRFMALYEVGDDGKVGLFVCGNSLLWYEFSNNEVQMAEAPTILRQQQQQQQQQQRLPNVSRAMHRKPTCTTWLKQDNKRGIACLAEEAIRQ